MTSAKTKLPRLIIVDDEPVILSLLCSVFEDQPYQVVSCKDGKSAWAAMDDGVDILLTDKNLPDINGLELTERAKALQPDAEVIILTGYASLDTALLAMKMGVFDYIVKPPKDLFEVRRKVGQARTKQALFRENRQLVSDLRDKNEDLSAAMTELKQIQSSLIQAEKLAGIGTLAAGVAHEVSSPLFGIMGLAEAMTDEEDLNTVHEYAREIVGYSRSIKEIVVELTGYSRMNRGDFLTTVNLLSLVNDAVRLITRTVPGTAELYTIDIAEDIYFLAKTTELQQVFVNLLKNAADAVVARHGAQGGRVWVYAEVLADRTVQIQVSDNGGGIPEDKISVVFDPFYTTKAPGQGTGLGLNIVYRIITKHQGSIVVESELNGGAMFTIVMPAIDEPNEAE
jgi:C4-dicarboxylate-specific signal transduction histidine kinase